MGSPADEEGHLDNEEPQRRVRIDIGFALGQTEVTVGQFRQFVDASKYVSDAERLGGSAVYEEASGRIAERRGMTWLLVPFAIVGLWPAGFIFLAAYAAASFFWAQQQVHARQGPDAQTG